MTTQATTGLEKDTRDIVKATVPILQERGDEITSRFYQLMFENHPELKNIFNQTNQRKGDQSKALANTVYAAAAHIDQLEDILPQVKQIAHKHKSLNIKPEHYPIVGKHLLLAMKDVLGDAASDDVINAWEKAYGVIADVFIETERQMYQETKNKVGGWVDFRDFKVVDKIVESDVITSFYLEPADGNPFPIYQPGQYITVKAEIEGEPYTHLRQYSLSCAPDEGVYRISVKREDAHGELPAGIVSNYLHSQIEKGSILPISAPSGDFTLNQQDTRPLILISGGVGLTPMMSMLEATIKQQPEREIYYIHAAQNGNVHAMKEVVRNLASEHEQIHAYTVYDNPSPADENFYDKEGYIDYEWLTSILPTNNADFYFCGPKGFMQAMYRTLKQYHVAEKDIHFEFFGPAQAITA
ncbi:NO-inducible flavohemoprotein [Virgibacillus dakarensis]|uniref:Flavohemoprotein n=1 Tax=Lentibacillus populi TaxID=1827502 RepID=A0A9W5X7K6_9BACI|nr:NO-inducible flavohemoprotein [Lentibacillus populi]MBT2215810.1 NO-inducible flavohemoprotein [Virgibacillus dakarensis]MTW86481.1 NO-inducible flavohemoprotein [Virgibacillus dakarensis]GGB56996.1 flavohemoprotein [Lentibacillus populi]